MGRKDGGDMHFLKGRTNRATYWVGLAILALMIGAWAYVAHGDAKVSEGVLIFIAVPRLHDIGRSGWFVLGPLVLEIVGVVAAVALLPLETAKVVMGVISLVIFGLMALLGCLPGTRVENRFGPPPAPGLDFKPRARVR
jgi:uncharacterized membrane protein YhaH (DUF805 family)